MTAALIGRVVRAPEERSRHYSLGLGVPFLLAALFTDALTARLKAFGRFGRSLQLLAGAVMIVMGLAMITGQLSVFAYWLLDVFPALTKIS